MLKCRQLRQPNSRGNQKGSRGNNPPQKAMPAQQAVVEQQANQAKKGSKPVTKQA